MSKLVPQNPAGVPSCNTIKGALKQLISWAQFSFPDFRISAHDGQRIKSLLRGLLKEGKLTKEPRRQAQSVGCLLTKLLVETALNDAITNGTANWDITISGVLNLLLLSSLAARSGDLVYNRLGEHPLPFLVYDDIVLRLGDGDEIEDLVASVKIRNIKGHK